MDLVSVHRLPLDLGRQAGGLAGDHVLLLLAHQPVLHRALGRRRDVTGQPALVPLVEALVLAGRHSVLRLPGGKGERETKPSEPRTRNDSNHCTAAATHLPGLDQSPSAVHVILRVHDKNHLVSVELEPTVQAAGVLHAQLAVPLSPAAHGLHLPHLPAAEAAQVPIETCVKHINTCQAGYSVDILFQ